MDQEQLNLGLVEAARRGDTKSVEDWVARGADVNCRNRVGRSPLHWAAQYGHTETVSRLVDLGGDVNVKDGDGWSPLHLAAWYGQTETMSRLVELGGHVNVKDDYSGRSPLHLAAVRGRTETVSRLVELGGDVNGKDDMNMDNSTSSSPASLIEQSHSSFTLPSRTTRGRRGSRGGRAVRRGVRTRGGRGRGRGQNRRVGGDNPPNRAELAEAAREARHAQVQERINTIPPNELREFVMQIYRRQPSFVLDIINLPSDQGSQGPPRDELPNADIPDWCICTHCRTMPTPEENVCCQQRPQNCHSRLRGKTPYDLADNDDIRELLKKYMSKEHESTNDDTTRTQPSVQDLLKELKELGLETVSEFKQMLQQGKYKCYWNRVYLVGPYGVGKTTLAKLLVEEEIPDTWNSTDGIFIYLGRAAMDTDSKKWVPLKKGTILNAAVMSLLKSKKNTVTQPLQEPSEVKTRPVQKEQHMLGPVGHVDSTTEQSKETEQGGTSDDEIMALVLKECSKGDYKMIVVPIDIWDFGGQKIYYLTHQLFISNRGTFVVTFNGSTDITEDMPDMAFLPGFRRRTTTADFLLHWVNSILTFCEKTTTPSGKKYPQILFVATHKDNTTNVDQQRNTIKDKLKALFTKHIGKDHLLIDQLFFLNAKDKNDEDLVALREALMDVAFEHPSWGEPMPTKFVPLELQLAKQASEGKKILSITEVKALNTKNEGMSLQPKELDTFLKVQHALGKLIYFDEDNLREYVVTDPAYLIDVLRSIVTEKLFWPKDQAIGEIYKSLSTTGIIEKSAILQLWQQTDFKHIFPFREFMINMLVRLDIMLEPKTQSEISYFLVPSMITDRPFKDKFQKEKCIYLAYRFTEQIIPPALLYRFLGSLIVLRNLNTDINKLQLFTDSAVVTIDSKHQVQAYVVGNRIILALMHEQSKSDIKPSIASTVQECLTRSIIGTTDFYCAIANTAHQKSMQFPFTIEFGVPCTDDICFVENKKTMSTCQPWECSQHKIQLDMTHDVSLWFSDKEPIQGEKCTEECQGLERTWLEQYPGAKHLRRLGADLNHDQTRDLFLALGLRKTKWDILATEFGNRLEDMHFYALWHWRESAKSPTFKVLLETFQKNKEDTCLLCKVVRDIKFEEDFSEDMMAWRPDDATLEDLSHHVGSATIQLGIELGLAVSDLENIERKHKDLKEQTRKVLKKWKKSPHTGKHERPVIELAKSLERVGKYRLIETLTTILRQRIK